MIVVGVYTGKLSVSLNVGLAHGNPCVCGRCIIGCIQIPIGIVVISGRIHKIAVHAKHAGSVHGCHV